jgi:hypothetical protein
MHLLIFIALPCLATWAGEQEYGSEQLRALHAQMEERTGFGSRALPSVFRDHPGAPASTSLDAFLMRPEDKLTPMNDADPPIDGTFEAMNSAPQEEAPPSPAAAKGDTRLDFSDDFDYPDTSFIAFNGAPGKTWNASLWYKPTAAHPADFSIGNSVLSIHKSSISSIQNSKPFPGKVWLGGYFEARMLCSAQCAFYLSSYDWARLSGNACSTGICDAYHVAGRQMDSTYGGVNEIDIIETTALNPNRGLFTVHKSGAGAGQGGFAQPDAVNKSRVTMFGSPLVGAWHTYGLLWTKNTLYWYVDNKLTQTSPAFTSTWQPAFIIFSVSPEPGVPDDALNMKLDWVKVWEPPAK